MSDTTDSTIPRHIAIIMDGNGRWARDRGLPRTEGHRAGSESVREAIEACRELGVEYLTLYAFSSENWKRPKHEITALMKLLERYLKDKEPELNDLNVRLQAIGRLDRLPPRARRQLDRTIGSTSDNTGLTLVLALSYGSREEIVDAARSLAEQVRDGKIDPSEIDNECFSEQLYTRDIPDPDLMIRTSGEMRLSNFLLWQLSYAELVITRKYWPEFRKADLHDALADYRRRQRRFGGL